jgi:ABC-type enterochelin transport system permease subunit
MQEFELYIYLGGIPVMIFLIGMFNEEIGVRGLNGPHPGVEYFLGIIAVITWPVFVMVGLIFLVFTITPNIIYYYGQSLRKIIQPDGESK